jgi:hypothetical protein
MRGASLEGARRSPKLVEQRDDVLVLNLREDVVPEPDGPEVLLRVRAHEIVRLSTERVDALRGGDRDGDDDLRGALTARPANGGHHRRSGRQPIIDQQRRPAVEIERRLALMKDLIEGVDLRPCLPDRAAQLGLTETVG